MEKGHELLDQGRPRDVPRAARVHVATIQAERAYQQHRRTTEKKKHQDELLRMEKGHEYLLEKEDKWHSQGKASKEA